MPRSSLEPIRQVLKDSIARGLRGLDEADRLAAAWTVACGGPMAGHGEVVGFRDGILVVEVADQAWLTQMVSMRQSLTHEVGRIAGIPLTAIHFERAGPKTSARKSLGRKTSGPKTSGPKT